MRYYHLEVNKNNKWITIDKLSPDNPNALNIILDSVETTGKASGNTTLSISNPANELLTSSFIGLTMRLQAGLKSALPLANADQIGYVAQGQIVQQIPDITAITKKIVYKLTSLPLGDNFVVSGAKGSLLSTLIQNTMNNAGGTPVIDISLNGITLTQGIQAKFNSFNSFCKFLSDTFNVEMLTKQGVYRFYINTQSTSSIKNIQWQDIIGQPVGESVVGNLTSAGNYQIGVVQIPCHARGDLIVGDKINLKVQAGNTQAISTSKYNAVNATGLDFAGTYQITSLRHTLQSRDPNPESWCTTITGNIV